MADIVVKRSELVGKAKGKTALVEHVARSNALNRTGKIDYNVGGTKDGGIMGPWGNHGVVGESWAKHRGEKS